MIYKEFDLIPASENEGYCGVSSLSYVARKFAIPTNGELAGVMKTTKEDGTSHAGMVRGAEALGLVYKQIEQATLDMVMHLKRGDEYEVIVDWMSGDNFKDDGHYSIVHDIDETLITLQDSTWGELRTMRRDSFDRRWFDFEGDRKIIRWALFLKKAKSAFTLPFIIPGAVGMHDDEGLARVRAELQLIMAKQRIKEGKKNGKPSGFPNAFNYETIRKRKKAISSALGDNN